MSRMIKAIKAMFGNVTRGIKALGKKCVEIYNCCKNNLFFIISEDNIIELREKVINFYNIDGKYVENDEFYIAEEICYKKDIENNFYSTSDSKSITVSDKDLSNRLNNDLEKAFNYIVSYFGKEWEGRFRWHPVTRCGDKYVISILN